MTLLPADPETIVLPYPAEVIYHKLRHATSGKPFIQPEENQLFFNGWVKPDSFRLSQRLRRTNYYAPLIRGRIETTNGGCILFVEYRLFPTTRYLLTFWMLIIPLCALLINRSALSFVISLGIVFLLYLVVWYNFKMQRETSRATLHQVLGLMHPAG